MAGPTKEDDGPVGGTQHPHHYRPAGLPPQTGGHDDEPRVYDDAVGDSAADYEPQRSDSLAPPSGPSGNPIVQTLPTDSRDDVPEPPPTRPMPVLTPTRPEPLIIRDEVRPHGVSNGPLGLK
ncbi:uncharacterized protein CLAFUR5_10206 [Fulvia fulva]|uniref:Uncharacterized protein n=1 Tax=Passalora fulva TaxID=5499 RepID=A0A9Q8PCJ4_PASFU|nr:uncharacterized protein CLAFUR5_10206 [Fulvia fulva]UJO19907.1 hypothetical protein CLAFUR5_10206 [Fulvia fulva]